MKLKKNYARKKQVLLRPAKMACGVLKEVYFPAAPANRRSVLCSYLKSEGKFSVRRFSYSSHFLQIKYYI